MSFLSRARGNADKQEMQPYAGDQMQQQQQKLEQMYRRLSYLWDAYLHKTFHYGFIPGVFVYGLVASGEWSWNPVDLFAKVVFA